MVVLEDDLPPVVSIADAGAVTEGGALAFPVTLSGPFSAQLTVGTDLAARRRQETMTAALPAP